MEFSRAELLAELEEKTKDLDSFLKAREVIRSRVLEVTDSGCKLTPLPNWSGTDAVLGSLDMACHAIERTIEELRGVLSTLPDEKPNLRIIHGERHVEET